MHLRKAEAFSSEEIKYLAKFPIITLEKTTGLQTFGSTERGSLESVFSSLLKGMLSIR